MDTRLIAHRGGRPENTLTAFRTAMQAGARALELDVRCSADGELVVIHDDTVDRTTGGHGRVSDLTSDQLSRLGVPSLREVLDLTRDRVDLFVEVKEKLPHQQLLGLLQGHTRARIISFDQDFLAQLPPEVPRGVLLEPAPMLKRLELWSVLGLGAGLALGHPVLGLAAGFLLGRHLGQNALLAGIQAPCEMVLPFWAGLDARFARKIHAQGRELIPYTANAPALVNALFRAGADRVVTDRCARPSAHRAPTPRP